MNQNIVLSALHTALTEDTTNPVVVENNNLQIIFPNNTGAEIIVNQQIKNTKSKYQGYVFNYLYGVNLPKLTLNSIEELQNYLQRTYPNFLPNLIIKRIFPECR